MQLYVVLICIDYVSRQCVIILSAFKRNKSYPHTHQKKPKTRYSQVRGSTQRGQRLGRLVNISLCDSPLFPSAHIIFTSSVEEQTDPQSIFRYLPTLLFREISVFKLKREEFSVLPFSSSIALHPVIKNSVLGSETQHGNRRLWGRLAREKNTHPRKRPGEGQGESCQSSVWPSAQLLRLTNFRAQRRGSPL